MCGINGVLRLTGDAPPIDPVEVDRTRDAMWRRGPDDQGTWISPGGEVALASRRLAILDLSSAGRQPMATEDGRYHLVMNGEIYNFRALRRELEREGVRFESTGDTEVVLRLLARHGPSRLRQLRGMFALAFWDDHEKTLLLARDPLGIKPLYYSSDAEQRGVLRFASQVKALDAGGAIDPGVDERAVAGFLLWGSVPEPLTIRRSLSALRAGQTLIAREGRISFGRIDPLEVSAPAETAADEDAVDAAREALERSVECHLESDVPIAVFLSAGLDSSLVAALAARAGAERLTTLTVTFEDFAGSEEDEGPLAARTAAILGTRHVEQRLGDRELGDLWERGVEAMDQPSIDGFNVFAVSEVASREGFKVVLSGLGGDELFGSYPSFRDVPRWAGLGRLAALPGVDALTRALGRLTSRPKLCEFSRWSRTLPGAYFLRRGLFLPSDLPRLLGAPSDTGAVNGYDVLGEARDIERRTSEVTPDPWVAIHQLETGLYMRNQLLRDADWASMAHSVELRVPLVDVVLQRELAALGFEPARSRGKAHLVARCAPELPSELFSRRKTGFGVPLARRSSSRRGASPPTPSKGLASRQIALAVLEQFGVDLEARAPMAHP